MPVTVRITQSDHRELKSLSHEMDLPMGQVLHQALALLRRQLFWQSTRDAYAALRADSGAWEDEQTERASWDHNAPPSESADAEED